MKHRFATANSTKRSPSHMGELGKDQNYLSRLALDNKFDNPEKLPNFSRIQYEELIADLESNHIVLAKSIIDTYLFVLNL